MPATDYDRYQNLFAAIASARPQNLLEVGTWTGKHAKGMIHAASALQHGNKVDYWGFDLFEDATTEVLEQEGTTFHKPPAMTESPSNALPATSPWNGST